MATHHHHPGNQLLTSNSDTELHSNGSLTLRNVRSPASGVYSCVVENGYMTIMSVAEIDVQSEYSQSERSIPVT